MATHEIGEIIEGTVVAIRSYGAIMLFDDGSKGLLHISQIADTYIKNIYRYLVIGKTYQVKIIELGDDGFLKVSMSKITQEEKDASRKPDAKKIPVQEENIDFTALKEKLPEWIEKESKND